MVIKKEWKEIKEYEGKYIISNYGEIISLPRYKRNNSKFQYVQPREICKYTNPKMGMFMSIYVIMEFIKTLDYIN